MTADLFAVADRSIVVTGGLGRLGRHFAVALLERGARVAVLDNASGRPSGTLQGPWPADRLMMLNADVVDRDSVEAAIDRLETAWGPPHGLVNSAGIDAPPDTLAPDNGPIEACSDAAWDRVIDANVKGVVHCCQAIGPRMAAAGRGSIVNIGSIYGMVSPDQRIYRYRWTDERQFFKPVAYSASKSALLGLTRYMATYWAQSNVRVNSLTFGGVLDGQDPRFLEGYAARVPLGRMARAGEYNGAVIFMLSDASSYMTGANVVLDGGWTAW